METIQDFEDVLELFDRFGVRYLIIGGLAFTFQAKPRYTKDIDLWVASDPENVHRTNRALAESGNPFLLDPADPDEILQVGVEPNRIDVLRDVGAVEFEDAWPRRAPVRERPAGRLGGGLMGRDGTRMRAGSHPVGTIRERITANGGER